MCENQQQIMYSPQIYSLLQIELSLGQLEHTILKTFSRMGKILRWLGNPGNPEGVLKVKEVFDKFYPSIFSSSSRISGNNEDAESNSSGQESENNTNRVFRATSAIPSELRPLLRTRSVKLHARMHLREVIFSTSRCHLGNSQILFKPVGYSMARPIPAIIKYICEFSDGSRRFIVQEVMPLPVGEVDRYGVYFDFPARRISTELNNTLRVVDPMWVVSQFLSWREDEDHMIIVPVFPVRPFLCQYFRS